MASPFRVFRKNQKALMAIAGVIIIFVFVLGDSLSQMFNSGPGAGGGPSPTDVAVKWNGGKLTNEELNQLVFRRLILNNFIRNVEVYGRQAAQEAGGEPAPLRVMPIIGAERQDQGVERDVLRTRLFADAARKAGMDISDDYLVNYLMQLGRGYVTRDTIRQIIAASGNRGRGATVDYILDALREEMLAKNYLASYVYAFETELPEDRWRDWLRSNDRVVVEAVPITAESLLADVKEPTDAELETFFNEYKDREPLPDDSLGVELPSPNPAFRIPQKVAIQYVKADFNEYLVKLEDEVTDAEISEFYEKYKDPLFIRAASILSEPGEEPKSESTPPADAPTGNPPADGAGAKPDANDGSSQRAESPFRLAAFQDEPAESDELLSPAPAAAAPAAAAPSESTPPTPAATEPAAEAEAAPEKPKEFQPLDEVRDQIRRDIAAAKVPEKLGEVMSSVERKLMDKYTEYFGASLEAEDAGKEPPPAPKELVDLSPLVNEYGLSFNKTELATWQELRDTDVGVSGRPEWGNARLFAAIFSRDYELFEPVATQDLDANRYITMKTADVPGKVPTLDEVRAEVVRAWKMREAGKLALKRAEELAKKAQDAGGSLTDAIAGDESLQIVKSDPFSYFTIGSFVPDTQQVNSFRLSEPDGIVAAGPGFMDKVFELKDGEVTAAPNHNNSIAYVVKVAQHLDPVATLRQDFLSEDFNWYGVLAMARGHALYSRSNVVADMFKSAGVEWVRDPDQVIRPEDEPEDDASAPADET